MLFKKYCHNILAGLLQVCHTLLPGPQNLQHCSKSNGCNMSNHSGLRTTMLTADIQLTPSSAVGLHQCGDAKTDVYLSKHMRAPVTDCPAQY